MASEVRKNVIANQIFVGCPWKTVRPKYERLKDELKKKFPISFIIIGQSREHRADDLLKTIKEKLESSSKAIFDATSNNPNVSLEFGYAEGKDIDSAIYLCTHGRAKERLGTSIISDLAGKQRKEYKNESGLNKLLTEYCKEHAYSKRFETLMRSKTAGKNRHQKKTFRALALKLIHMLNDRITMRREDLINEATHAPGGPYDIDEIDECLKKLHAAKLVFVSRGRYSDVKIY